MNVPPVDLKSQYLELKEEIDAAVLGVLASGFYVQGVNVRTLEEEIATAHGAKFGIAVNSGTDAQKIALQAMGIGPGDEVITTPFSFGATVECILQNGAKPVFVDIDPRTYNMDASQIEKAITPRTRAIHPVHLFGQLCDIEGIVSIADKHGLMVFEDGAQAIGSTRNGSCCAALTKGASLSFYATKNLGAIGDGGMVLTNDEKVAELCRVLRIHGGVGSPYWYEYVGHTSRLSELQAAVLRVKFRKLGQWNDLRQAHAKIYDRALEGTGIAAPFVDPQTTYHTYHQYTVRCENRDEFLAYLKEHQVGAGVYYPFAFHLTPAYAELGYKKGDLPEAEKAGSEVLSLPIQSHLTTEQVEYAADVARHFAVDKAAV